MGGMFDPVGCPHKAVMLELCVLIHGARCCVLGRVGSARAYHI